MTSTDERVDVLAQDAIVQQGPNRITLKGSGIIVAIAMNGFVRGDGNNDASLRG
ncbi:hypothetical protein [Burkholderia anthina]|uniref:hypothetical protein n=1 Tax=Burkholderia anthina TaxID=179879 RepID=UPI00158A0468|nr:hypothetical protein [Burkholderia anthina]